MREFQRPPDRVGFRGNRTRLHEITRTATVHARGERAYSNWELSADRANASRQELVAGGMNEGRVMRIQGLASNMSMIRDDPYAAVNRRISLVILNESTQRRIEQENAAAANVSVSDARELSPAVSAERGAMPTPDAAPGVAAEVPATEGAR